MWQKIKENTDVIVVAIVAFLIGFGSASLFGGNDGNMPAPRDKGEETIELGDLPFEVSENKGDAMDSKTIADVAIGVQAADGNTISVDNQRAGESVQVAGVTFTAPGWVAVREVSNGVFGNVLGAAWFPAGTHTNVMVELLRSTEGGEEYAVVLYTDTADDRQFLLEQDKLITDQAGKIVMSPFTTVANPSGF